MLQACSILYKSKLPMLLVFNKTDVSRHEFALDWMADFETFHVALQADSSYASTLSKSLSLVCSSTKAHLAQQHCLACSVMASIASLSMPRQQFLQCICLSQKCFDHCFGLRHCFLFAKEMSVKSS